MLWIVGNALDNSVMVSRTAGGTILVNGGAVPIQGGTATVANTRQVFINGGAGNDNLSLNEANGALPGAALFGGDGNDTLVGGRAVLAFAPPAGAGRGRRCPARVARRVRRVAVAGRGQPA